MGETAQLASFIQNLTYERIDDDIITRAKRLLLDYTGVALLGSQSTAASKITSYVTENEPGSAATIFGDGTGSTTGAALANGVFAHATDFDDSFTDFPLHPSAPIYSAALSVGEAFDASGKEILTGYIAGTEVAYRLGKSFHPSHYVQGWHSTGTLGTLGAAVAAGKILDISGEQLQRTIAIAATSSSGVKGSNFGTMTKPLHSGNAAQMGVRAALLGKDGFTASTTILEENAGYRDVMIPGDVFDPNTLTTMDQADVWDFELVRKPNPSGIMTQSAIETTRNIMLDEGLSADSISEVHLTLPITAELERAGFDPDAGGSEPRARHKRPPKNEYEKHLSFPFCIGVVLTKPAPPNIEQFANAATLLDDSEMKRQMSKVTVVYERDLFTYEFGGFGVIVTIKTTDGREYSESCKFSTDTSSNPLPEERFEEKYRLCAGFVLDDTAIEELESAVLAFEKEGRSDTYFEQLRQ